MVNGGFEHFQRRMGLEEAETLGLDSPFNYPEQAMLCVPRYLPEPNSFKMRETLLETAKRLIKASRGRCFCYLLATRCSVRLLKGLKMRLITLYWCKELPQNKRCLMPTLLMKSRTHGHWRVLGRRRCARQ